MRSRWGCARPRRRGGGADAVGTGQHEAHVRVARRRRHRTPPRVPGDPCAARPCPGTARSGPRRPAAAPTGGSPGAAAAGGRPPGDGDDAVGGPGVQRADLVGHRSADRVHPGTPAQRPSSRGGHCRTSAVHISGKWMALRSWTVTTSAAARPAGRRSSGRGRRRPGRSASGRRVVRAQPRAAGQSGRHARRTTRRPRAPERRARLGPATTRRTPGHRRRPLPSRPAGAGRTHRSPVWWPRARWRRPPRRRPGSSGITAGSRRPVRPVGRGPIGDRLARRLLPYAATR